MSASIRPKRSRHADTPRWTAASSRTSPTKKPSRCKSAARPLQLFSSTPKIKTGFATAHMRATAAAIPDEPVIKRTSSTWLFEQMLQTLAVGFVERFQLRGGAGVAHKLMTGQQHRFYSPSEQSFGRRAANHVDDHCPGYGRNRPGSPLNPLQFDHAITRRALVVDDQVSAIDKLLARRVGRLRLFAMRPGHDGNHRQSTPLGTHGGFHNYWTNSAGRNHDEGVVRPEVKAVQNLLSVTFVVLQIEGRTQSVRSHDCRMIGERQFHQRHETDKATLTRSHLLAHHPRVSIAKKKNQAAARDP